jgi:hypothetical protein
VACELAPSARRCLKVVTSFLLLLWCRHFRDGFAGSLPSSIGLLTDLQYLAFNGVDLIGTIPSELWNLHSLTYLEFTYTQCSGTLSTRIGELSQLRYFRFLTRALKIDEMSGVLPSQLGLLHLLTTLQITAGLSGTLPQALFHLTALTVLDLEGMHFDNAIPSEIGLLGNLVALRVSSVPVRGAIPHALFGLTRLNVLDLSGTYLEGTIPSAIVMLSNLRHLVLSNRRIIGSLPPELWLLTDLNLLQLSGNLIDGTLSDSIGALSKLQWLVFDSNRLLSGVIPSTIGSLTRLTNLSLRGNSFSGALPTTLAHLTQLTSLTANMNRLTGDMPPLPLPLSWCAVEARGSVTAKSESNCLRSCTNAPKCCGSAVVTCAAFNDDCQWAMPIRDSAAQVSSVNATTQPCSLCSSCAIGSDVWFSWISVCTGIATFDLCAVDSATAQVAMAIYDPDWCQTSTPCAVNSNRSTCSPTSSGGVRSTHAVVRNEEYRIQVGFADINASGVIAAPLTISCRDVTTTTIAVVTTTQPTTSASTETSTSTLAISSSQATVSPLQTTTTHIARHNGTSVQQGSSTPTSPFVIVGALVAAILVSATLLILVCRRLRYLQRLPQLRLESASANVEAALVTDVEPLSLPKCRALCLAYTDALAAVYSRLMLRPPDAAEAMAAALSLRERNRRCLSLFCKMVQLSRQSLRDQIAFAVGNETFAHDVFVAHEGRLKPTYVGVTLREGLERAGVHPFIDSKSIHSFHGSKESAIEVGLLTSSTALIVLSEGFVTKKWPLYELFYALARCDDDVAPFGIVVDLYNELPDKAGWFEIVERLALPWPDDTDLPPSVVYNQLNVGAHRDVVIGEVQLLIQHMREKESQMKMKE